MFGAATSRERQRASGSKSAYDGWSEHVTALLICLALWLGLPADRPVLESHASQASGFAQWLLGEFEGTLPCADCSGIRTTLTLYGSGTAESNDGTFILRETYLGRLESGRTFVLQGRWTMVRGNAADRNATIYQLTPDPPAQPRFFLRVDDDELRLLDRQQRPIVSTAPVSLWRTAEASTLGGYLSASQWASDVQEAAEFAAREQAARSGTRIALRSVVRAQKQIVAGANYRLCLEVVAGTSVERAAALVARDAQDRLTLMQWTVAACQ